MTKGEIIEKVQELVGNYEGTADASGFKKFKVGEPKISKVEAGRIWEAFLEIIADEVSAGNEVKFGNLFKVYKKHQKARKVRNPKTGEFSMKEAKDVLGVKTMKGGKNLFTK